MCYVHNQWYDISCATLYVKKIRVSLKSDKNNEYFTKIPQYIYGNISLNSYYNKKYLRQESQKKIKTHFIFNNSFPKIVPFMR